jgi:ribosome recycling factor
MYIDKTNKKIEFMEDVKTYLDAAESKMVHTVEFLDETLAHIRAGKASPKLLDNIRVDYYGSMMPISGAANVQVPDARTIVITPWEKSMFRVIEKAIIDSELGITPENNGEVIRISIPPLTEERRKALVKQSKNEVENAKVSIRNARRDAIEGLKKAVKNGMSEDVSKDGEAEVQKLHDKMMKRLDELFAAKEKEILTV